MYRQKNKSISNRKGNGDINRERKKRKTYQYTDRYAHGHISILEHRHYQLNIPSWNIRCVPRNRLKLVSRKKKIMILIINLK